MGVSDSVKLESPLFSQLGWRPDIFSAFDSVLHLGLNVSFVHSFSLLGKTKHSDGVSNEIPLHLFI